VPINSLGRLALAPFQRPALGTQLVIITAYMDESGTHAGSPLSVMSVFVGNVRQWVNFEKKANPLFRKFGVQTFHAKKLRAGHADFDGWTLNKKLSFVDRLGEIVNTTLAVGCSTVLSNYDYEKYYLSGHKPKKLPLDTAYGVMFRASLSFASHALLEWPEWKKEKKRTLNVVLESGSDNSGDVRRLFNLFKGDLPEANRELIGSLSLMNKHECMPLAVADMLAYSVYRLETNAPGPEIKNVPKRNDASYRGNFYRLPVTVENLVEMKNNLLDEDRRILEFGKRRPKASS